MRRSGRPGRRDDDDYYEDHEMRVAIYGAVAGAVAAGLMEIGADWIYDWRKAAAKRRKRETAALSELADYVKRQKAGEP